MVLTVKLGIAYYNQGFINIQKRYSEYFGNDNESIKIHLGSSEEVIIDGSINLTAKNNFNEIITIVILNPQYPNQILIKDKTIR